jgi:hypothetical protein
MVKDTNFSGSGQISVTQMKRKFFRFFGESLPEPLNSLIDETFKDVARNICDTDLLRHVCVNFLKYETCNLSPCCLAIWRDGGKPFTTKYQSPLRELEKFLENPPHELIYEAVRVALGGTMSYALTQKIKAILEDRDTWAGRKEEMKELVQEFAHDSVAAKQSLYDAWVDSPIDICNLVFTFIGIAVIGAFDIGKERPPRIFRFIDDEHAEVLSIGKNMQIIKFPEMSIKWVIPDSSGWYSIPPSKFHSFVHQPNNPGNVYRVDLNTNERTLLVANGDMNFYKYSRLDYFVTTDCKAYRVDNGIYITTLRDHERLILGAKRWVRQYAGSIRDSNDHIIAEYKRCENIFFLDDDRLFFASSTYLDTPGYKSIYNFKDCKTITAGNTNGGVQKFGKNILDKSWSTSIISGMNLEETRCNELGTGYDSLAISNKYVIALVRGWNCQVLFEICE